MTTCKSPSFLSGISRSLLAAVILGAASHVGAQNLLVNGDFNDGLTGWGTWTSGGWVNAEVPGKLAGTTPTTWPSGPGTWPGGAGTNAVGTGPLYDGSLQLTLGQGGAGSGSYANQTVAGVGNALYTLTVQGGADSWWLPYGETRLFFLDASDNLLSSSIVRTTDSIHNEYNGGIGDFYDVGVPYQDWANIAVSPIGTAWVKVELTNPVGNGSTWFDNAVLTVQAVPEPSAFALGGVGLAILIISQRTRRLHSDWSSTNPRRHYSRVNGDRAADLQPDAASSQRL